MADLTERDVPTRIDTTKASIARVYDAALNGKDNYEVDREVLRQVRQVAPEVNQLAWDNRDFLIRAARFLGTQAGITQYLDCGSGLPTAENTHQVVQRVNPEAKVVYVDNDPVVLAHGRALLEENEHTHFTAADIFRPREIIENETVRAKLDFTRPLALFQVGTLHHYDERQDEGHRSPGEIMREYVDALPSGSYVVIAHFFDPESEPYSELARKMEERFVHSPMGTGLFRTRAQIEDMFPGLEMVDPGITLCTKWWPDGPRIKPLDQVQYCIVGGVGRKP
ncbi:S-adenosyl methyltransferase [Tamaricihabitans halophyticus]|uniref:S-adenosyl methyltransferase n=1 Tax=Tamaricihabitans halophyticus TaxID=1262583 RepID=A0A4R2R1C8_9PSEU|nr:SAM-dependent methyltransferase [Tamaricihabitans halophyticus]TCP56303.1 S-adenosyl methyltransferase [Tamaricihabitans halophyticus]